jgi:arylsulfatase A-like enzyme
VIKPGSQCAVPICHVDLFATAAAVAKAKLPSPAVAAPDSFSLLPLLQGRDKQFKRAPVVNHSASGVFALRDGDWKLVLGDGSGGREKPRGHRFARPFRLYNLAEDPGETTDRYATDTAVAQKLESALFTMLNEEKSR